MAETFGNEGSFVTRYAGKVGRGIRYEIGFPAARSVKVKRNRLLGDTLMVSELTVDQLESLISAGLKALGKDPLILSREQIDNLDIGRVVRVQGIQVEPDWHKDLPWYAQNPEDLA